MRPTRSTLAAFAMMMHIGCSTAQPSAPAVEAAWNLTLAAASSGKCNHVGATVAFGAVNESAFSPIESRRGAGSSCFVRPDSGNFFVNAITGTGAIGFTALIKSMPANASQTSPATGEITADGLAPGGLTAAGTCNFYFKNPTATTECVQTGSIWCAFVCPTLAIDGGSNSETCAGTESFMFFRNCAQSPGL